jgi:FkbM family methyltransferase
MTPGRTAKSLLRGALDRADPAWTNRARRLSSLRPTAPSGRPASPRATYRDIAYCYRILLGREPDAHGLEGYKSIVRDGHISRQDLVGYFLSSPEFHDRLAKNFEYATGVPLAVKVGDLTYYVDPDDAAIGASLRRQGEYEPEVTSAVRRHLRPGQCFVDVGASFGYFATLAGSIVGPQGRLIAFEPGPQNQSMLLLNLSSNGVGSPEVHQMALSSEAGFVLYSYSGSNGFITPFTGDPAELANRTLVRTSTLDTMLAHHAIDMIKIDVEGAEGRVLKGGESVLRRDHPIILMEFSPPSLEATSQMSGRDLLGYLIALGYSVDLVGPDRTPRTPEEILRAFGATPADHIDLQLWAG